MINAIYVSVWDGGTRIETTCKFDIDQNCVSDIQVIYPDDEVLEILDEEFVELPDGTEVKTFRVDEGSRVVNGRRLDTIRKKLRVEVSVEIELDDDDLNEKEQLELEGKILAEMDYSFTYQGEGARIVGHKIIN